MAKKSAEQLIEEEFPATGNETPLTDISLTQTLIGDGPSPDDVGINPNQDKVDVLAQFKGQANPLYPSDIVPSYEQKLQSDIDAYAGAIPAQAFSTYFPSMTNDIQKGSYSGRIIGNNPIYAPSALMPFGLIDARQNALKAAANKKALDNAAKAKKFQELTAPPTTEHKAVQQDLQNNFYTWLADAQKKAKDKYPGKDMYSALMDDPQFSKELNFYKNLGEYETQLVKQTAEIQEGIKTGKYAETPFIRKRINEIYTGQHGMLSEALNPEGYQKALQQFNLAPVFDLLETSKAAAKDIQYDVFEGMANITPQEQYDMLTSTKTESVAKKRLDDIVEQTWKSRYEGKEDLLNFTKADLRDAILSNFAVKTTTTTQTASTSAGGGGLNFKFDPNAVEQETKVINATGTNANGNVNIKLDIPTEDGYTMPKKITAKLSTGAKWFDVGDSQGGNVPLSKTSGVKDVDLSEIRNFPMKNGKILDKKALATAIANKEAVEYKTFAVGSFMGDESTSDGYKQKTVIIPIDEVKGAVEQRDPQGKLIKGVDTKYYEEKAKSRSTKAAGKSYTEKQEALIKKNMAANPDYSREEIINALGY